MKTYISTGILFGSAMVIAISFTLNKSILWAMNHGLSIDLSWVYVIYVALFITY